MIRNLKYARTPTHSPPPLKLEVCCSKFQRPSVDRRCGQAASDWRTLSQEYGGRFQVSNPQLPPSKLPFPQIHQHADHRNPAREWAVQFPTLVWSLAPPSNTSNLQASTPLPLGGTQTRGSEIQSALIPKFWQRAAAVFERPWNFTALVPLSVMLSSS